MEVAEKMTGKQVSFTFLLLCTTTDRPIAADELERAAGNAHMRWEDEFLRYEKPNYLMVSSRSSLCAEP